MYIYITFREVNVFTFDFLTFQTHTLLIETETIISHFSCEWPKQTYFP